jgi:hypothetical protein
MDSAPTKNNGHAEEVQIIRPQDIITIKYIHMQSSSVLGLSYHTTIPITKESTLGDYITYLDRGSNLRKVNLVKSSSFIQ